MKRFLASALLIGASSFGLVGCDSAESEKKVETTVSGPEGKTTETSTVKTETEGKNPPSADAPAPPPATTTEPAKPAEPATPAPTPEAPK